jgi:hypothetical protein
VRALKELKTRQGQPLQRPATPWPQALKRRQPRCGRLGERVGPALQAAAHCCLHGPPRPRRSPRLACVLMLPVPRWAGTACSCACRPAIKAPGGGGGDTGGYGAPAAASSYGASYAAPAAQAPAYGAQAGGYGQQPEAAANPYQAFQQQAPAQPQQPAYSMPSAPSHGVTGSNTVPIANMRQFPTWQQ